MCPPSARAFGPGGPRAAKVGAMQAPEHLRYSNDHEWISVDGTRVRLGITDYAQHTLGTIVYVQLPEVGATLTAGESLGEVESTKSVSDVYAPVSGTVVAVNDALDSGPEALNSDPYGTGWICEIEMSNSADAEGLLDAVGYQALIDG